MRPEDQLSLDFMTRAKSAPPDPHETVSLEQAHRAGVFSTLDVEFAERLGRLYGTDAPEILWALALACRQESRGHVCADLARLAEVGLLYETSGEGIKNGEREAEDAGGAEPPGLGATRTERIAALPAGLALASWEALLRKSPLVAGVRVGDARAESGRAPSPLLLDDRQRLYLRRSFLDQAFVAAALQRRMAEPDFAFDEERVLESVGGELGMAAADASPDGREATLAALRMGHARPLSIITGGPGTGKTTLVVRLISLLVEEVLAKGADPPVVRLLAPTGKAAAAMTASFARQRGTLGLREEVVRALPTGAETIHRALLPRTRRDAFGRSRSFSLDADIVVVDEASMVDLALMRALFEATESAQRVILLGDPDQLASVDSGAVLAELCEAAKDVPALSRSRVHLSHSHRFESGGAIGRLAQAIREGDADRALAILDDPAHPEVSRRPIDSIAGVRAHLAESARQMQRAIVEAAEPGAKLERLLSGRVLCAHRQGPLGSLALCEVLDAAAASVRETTSQSGWWRGRLLLVTRNAPEQDLWNGDVGLVEEFGDGLRALFPDARGGVRFLSAGRLPAFESAIAMSVHKSQGSEFDRVELVIGETASGLMTRELLYTGVTRAREHLCLHASEDAIRVALARRVERDSGLADLLREGP